MPEYDLGMKNAFDRENVVKKLMENIDKKYVCIMRKSNGSCCICEATPPDDPENSKKPVLGVFTEISF